MAKLHRGVLGLPYRAALIALAFGFAPAVASAQREIGVDDIIGWAADLRSDDAARRRAAYENLSHLPESALPAIAERIEQTRRQIVPARDGLEALRAFRHAVGSRRADDMVDIAPGVLPVLEERRSREFGRTAERLLLLRSLEAIGTVEAQRRIADIFSLTNEMWRWEQRRVVHRMGLRLLPGLILARAHRDRGVRLWARGHIRKLGMKDPANALRIEDPELLAQVIDAYAEVRDLDTMPLILSYVGHEDRRIREAARRAFERFGRNGIWQLREGIRKQLGRAPDARWGWRRTMRELFDGLDERRLAPYARRLDEAKRALAAHDHGRARALLDALLRDAPRPPRAGEVAGAYAELADALDEPRLLRRAVWLAPDGPDAAAWRARLRLWEAEQDRARGVLDMEAYEEALRADPREPTLALARAVLGDEVSDADATSAPGPAPDDAPVAWWLVAFGVIAAGTLGWRRRAIFSSLRRRADWRSAAAHLASKIAPFARDRWAGTLRGTLRRWRRSGVARAAMHARRPGADPGLGRAASRPTARAVSAPTATPLSQLVLGANPTDTIRATSEGSLVATPEPRGTTEGTALDPSLDPPLDAAPDTEPGFVDDDEGGATQPGLSPAALTPSSETSGAATSPIGLDALMLGAPRDADTLPGAPAPR